MYRRWQELEIREQHDYSEITDAQLDVVIQSIVQNSPNSGQVMMRLICWGLVIHGGIDGFSRTIVYLGCNSNNEATTVLDLFINALHQFHIPHCIRSDHGTENVEVAKWMLHHHGTTSNHVLTGRSVHNQRIERLWRDATESFINLYQRLFYFMESHQLLDPLDEVHIYALHFVYLPRIRRSVEEFILQGNNHTLSSEQNKTPYQVWTEGFYSQANSSQQAGAYCFGRSGC